MPVEFNHYELIFEEAAVFLKEAVDETVTEIERDVKGRAETATAGGSTNGGAAAAPYKTGNARRSYHVDFEGTNGAQIEAHIGNDPGIADYVIYLEYGTSKMAPRPHLTPSSEAQRAPHQLRVAAALTEAAKATGRLPG
jgi:hypothetical protein